MMRKSKIETGEGPPASDPSINPLRALLANHSGKEIVFDLVKLFGLEGVRPESASASDEEFMAADYEGNAEYYKEQARRIKAKRLVVNFRTTEAPNTEEYVIRTELQDTILEVVKSSTTIEDICLNASDANIFAPFQRQILQQVFDNSELKLKKLHVDNIHIFTTGAPFMGIVSNLEELSLNSEKSLSNFPPIDDLGDACQALQQSILKKNNLRVFKVYQYNLRLASSLMQALILTCVPCMKALKHLTIRPDLDECSTKTLSKISPRLDSFKWFLRVLDLSICPFPGKQMSILCYGLRGIIPASHETTIKDLHISSFFYGSEEESLLSIANLKCLQRLSIEQTMAPVIPRRTFSISDIQTQAERLLHASDSIQELLWTGYNFASRACINVPMTGEMETLLQANKFFSAYNATQDFPVSLLPKLLTGLSGEKERNGKMSMVYSVLKKESGRLTAHLTSCPVDDALVPK